MPYTLVDLPFFLCLPFLMLASGLFSGSETAYFGLSSHQRLRLTQGQAILARAVAGLLDDQRKLLVTLMIGNMAVNTLYFVICSALLLKLEGKPSTALWVAALTVFPVLGLIIVGEVVPKLAANALRVAWVEVTAIPLLALHRAAGPIVTVVSRWVIEPLGRLLAPPLGPTNLTSDELQTLLESSHRRGVIGQDEQQLVGEVIHLTEHKVRDLMVPRVDIRSVDVTADSQAVRDLFARTGLSKLIAVEGDVDHLVGVLYRRQFLLSARKGNVDLRKLARGVRFVPEIQSVPQLLAEFRRTRTKLAIAVDEYGGTAGLITLKDIVERMVGELDMQQYPGESSGTTLEQVGEGVWRVGGRLNIHDWADAFAAENLPPRVSTVGGLVVALLGSVPRGGERVSLGNLTLEIESVIGDRVETLLIRLNNPARMEDRP